MLSFQYPLHQPLHLAHLALQEPVDEDLAPVGIEGDGGEAGEGIHFFNSSKHIKKICFREIKNLISLILVFLLSLQRNKIHKIRYGNHWQKERDCRTGATLQR